ncbi:MAG TPA: ATPase, partial [Nitrospira sp.]
LGVSTRGALALSKSAKALACVRGRDYSLPDDIKELAPIVLSHRVMLNRTHGMRSHSLEQAERIILDIVETVPVPV